MADFFQMTMSSDLWEGTQHPKFIGANEKYRLEGFGMPFCLTAAFLQSGLDLNDLGKVASSVTFAYVFNVKISVSDVVVFLKNDDVVFGKVQDVVVWKDKLFFNVEIFVKVCFSSNLNAFNLLRTPHTLVINPESLLYPWPLYSYTKTVLFMQLRNAFMNLLLPRCNMYLVEIFSVLLCTNPRPHHHLLQ